MSNVKCQTFFQSVKILSNKFARYHYQYFDNNKKSNNQSRVLKIIDCNTFLTFSCFEVRNITGKLSEEKNKNPIKSKAISFKMQSHV